MTSTAMRHQELPALTNETSGVVLDAAIQVHRTLGPGMAEWVYREALLMELEARGRHVVREKHVDAYYLGRQLPRAFRLDLLVDDRVIVELKAVEDLHPSHFAQLRSYLGLTGLELGLLMNFHAPRIVDGTHRIVLRSSTGSVPSAAPTLRGEG